MEILTKQAIKMINSNGRLNGKVCQVLGLAPASLRNLMRENTDERLASEGVVNAIKESLLELQNMQILANEEVAA